MDKFIDIVGMSKLANERSKINPNVINATTGVLKNESGQLQVYKTIDNILKSIDVNELYDYPAIDGGDAFKAAVMSWVFKGYESLIKDTFSYGVVATPGSTAAIFCALKNSGKNGDKVLNSNICWANYRNIITDCGLVIKDYVLFDSDRFNLKGFINTANEIIKTQKNLIVLINDPCHNPTSYSLSREEWLKLIEYFNSLKEKGIEISLIYDIAYIDYAYDKYEDTREILKLIVNFDTHVTNYVCFSGSKAFSVYGLRLGALIILSKQDASGIAHDIKAIARSTWSMAPSVGERVLISLMNDKKIHDEFITCLNDARVMLLNRKNIFLKEAKECNLVHYPVSNGFFVSIPCGNSSEVREKLLNDDIHVVPDNGFIRVAISNIPTKQIYGLARKIWEALK